MTYDAAISRGVIIYMLRRNRGSNLERQGWLVSEVEDIQEEAQTHLILPRKYTSDATHWCGIV
jgi:hypothetical protein